MSSNAVNALGASGIVNIGAGSGLSAGPVVVFDLVDQTINQLSILGNAPCARLATNVLGALDFSGSNAALTVAGQGVLILQGGADGRRREQLR